MTEVYPAAASIIEQQVASERKVCDFLSINRSSFQAWRRPETTEREESDAVLQPMIMVTFGSTEVVMGVVESLKS